MIKATVSSQPLYWVGIRHTSTVFDLGGRLTKIHDPRGASNDVAYTYDGLDRVTTTAATNLSGSIGASYDALGERLSMTDGTGSTAFQYDALGRVKQVTAPTTGVVGYGYDANGNRTSLTYPSGTQLGYQYFADGQLQTVTQSATTLATYGYDAAGRVQTITKSNGAVTGYSYDGADRVTDLSTSASGTVLSDYGYQYDRIGQTTVATEKLQLGPPSPTATATVTNTPVSTATNTATATATSTAVPGSGSLSGSGAATSGAINLTTLGTTDWAHWGLTASTSFDHKASVTSQIPTFTLTNGGTVGHAGLYTNNYSWTDGTPTASATTTTGVYLGGVGHGFQLVLPADNVTTRTLKLYLGFNKVQAQFTATLSDGSAAPFSETVDNATGTTYRTYTLSYKAGIPGQTLTVVWALLTDHGSGSVQLHAATLSTAPPPTSTPTSTATSTPAPPPTSTRTITYSYDGIQRLTGATESPGSSFTYTYDASGNRTGGTVNGTPTTSHSYDSANKVIGWTYDAAGNLTNDGTTSYAFDALGRLTGTTATGQTRSYGYNGDNTLTSATVNGASTSYTQDQAGGISQMLASTSGGTTTDYLYANQSERLASLTSSIRTWYGTDNQGSVRQSLSDSGSVLGSQNYDPYGTPEGATHPATFGYTGELQDGTTNAQYLRARWYQPGTGTLLGVDPMLDTTGQPYSYAGDNPVNAADPGGKCSTQLGNGTSESPGLASQLCAVLAAATTRGNLADPTSLPPAPSVVHGVGASPLTCFDTVGENSNQPKLYFTGKWVLLNGSPGLGGRGGNGTLITQDTLNLGFECHNADYFGYGVVAPLPGTKRAGSNCPNVPRGSTLIVVRFITACSDCLTENHSMIYTTAGQDGGVTWKTELTNPGGTIQIDGPTQVTSSTQLAHEYLGANAEPFWLISHRPIAWVNAKLSAMAKKINHLKLEYLPVVRNCNSFTHTALLRLGFSDGQTDGHIPDEALFSAIGWNSIMKDL
jgi:RHS repeat-associated protein